MTKYRIEITSRAQKDYKKLDPPVREKISRKILELENNPFPSQFKPLTGAGAAQYRLRVGDWRILYDVYDDAREVLILRLGHHKDIYR